MASLELFFLGPAEVKVNQKVIKLGLKPLAVLAYLALEGRSNRRELARKLWPEASDSLNSLSAARVSLTKSLGGWIEGDNETIALTPGFYCDVLEFREKANWQLWRGTFLHGFRLPDWENGLGEEFEEWIYNTRETLTNERRDLASKLANEQLKQGNLENAVPLLEIAQGEADDPREDATRSLILTLGALGFSDQAGAIYNNLSRNLRSELGVEPTASTRAAWEMARASSTACRKILQKEYVSTTIQPVISPIENETPFVGREIELNQLKNELTRALSGEVRAVLIAGEPGAGKTRLVYEVTESAQTKALIAVGIAAQSGLPLVALDRVARILLRFRPQAVEAMASTWRDALARFVPDLLTPQGPAASPETERRSLFEALRFLLTDSEKPTILFLDDLQWADTPTLEFASHILANPPQKGFFLIGTLRNTEESTGNLRLLTEPLARQGLGQTIDLGPLSETAIKDLAQKLGRDENIGYLSRFSGGNPFYLIELLQAEPESSTKRLQDLVRARLDSLPEVSNQLLEALAIIGNGTNMAMLRKVSGRSLDEAADSLEKLSNVGILRLEDEGIRFSHELTRQVVVDDMKKVRRELLELRTAHSFSNPVLAAPHYWESKSAWDDTDIAQALDSFISAGSTYALRGDLKGGLIWFARGFEISENNTNKIRVLTARAGVLERHLQFEEAEKDLDQAQLLAVGADPITQASIWNARGLLLATRFGDAAGAAELAQKSIEVLKGLDIFEAQLQISDAYNNWGIAFHIQNDLENAEKYHKTSLNIRETLGIKDKIARSLHNLGTAMSTHNQYEAKMVLTRAIEIFNDLQDQVNLVGVYNNLAIVEYNLGNYQEAEKNLLSAMQIQRLFGEEYIPVATFNNLGAALFQQKKFKEARETYKKAILNKNILQNPRDLTDIYVNLAEVEVRLGLFDEAKQRIANAHSIIEIDDTDGESLLSFQEGEISVFEKNYHAAITFYRQAVGWAVESQNAERQAIALARLARLEKSVDLATRAIEIQDVAITRASLLFALGKYEEAKQEIHNLHDEYEEKRLVWDINWLVDDNTIA